MNDGVLERGDDGRHRLRFVRRLRQPPEQVWRAVTDPDHLRAWFPCEVRGERRAGARLSFVFDGDEDGAIAGELLVHEPPTVLEMRWGDEVLRFELAPADDGGTVLTFVNTIGELGKAARDAAGWHVGLEVLAEHLDGRSPPWDPRGRWDEVHPRYVAAFGPDAATVGPSPGR